MFDLTPPPSANIDFSASETSIKVTESIRFSYTNCGLPISGLHNDSQNSSFLWTIDDPNDSYLPIKSRKMYPTFSFYNPGTYDVKLEVTVNGTTYTENKTNHITVTGYSSNSNGWANGSNGSSLAHLRLRKVVQHLTLVHFGKVWFKRRLKN